MTQGTSTSRPAVVHVSQPVDGGVAAVVEALATDQAARGWDVHVATGSAGRLPERLVDRPVSVHRWEATRSPGRSTPGEIVRLATLLRTVRPDVVHLHSSKAGLAGRLAVRGRAVPTIFQPHLWSFEADDGAAARPALLWERLAARWADAIVCVSSDECLQGVRAGIDGRLVVVPNGVDTDRIRPGDRDLARREVGIPDGPLAVCVARLSPLKGHDYLLRAWPAVLRDVPGARLAIVGAGPLREELFAEHPIASDPSVLWIGDSPNPCLYMCAADVVVAPSRAEGMALVPLEAMASGRALVAFAGGGMRESIGDAGAVLDVGDLAGLARGITARLRDGELAAREGRLGRARAVSRFDTRRVADDMAALVTELVGRR
ncbi:glycosyltransferase family 4 protein [Dietzia sp. WMMA184]|uniref:glycosyltransferase family 4 protein n=1 Tax=Dietzia sp. WMMA184 TaxID=2039808 RepID=UPI0020B10F3F|nr:glycosyltransferase family 4 protein [Dietzia sp. WMMA184]